MAKRKTQVPPSPPGPRGADRGVPPPATPPEADTRPAEDLDPLHRPAVEEGMAQAAEGRMAGDAEVEAMYRRGGV